MQILYRIEDTGHGILDQDLKAIIDSEEVARNQKNC